MAARQTLILGGRSEREGDRDLTSARGLARRVEDCSTPLSGRKVPLSGFLGEAAGSANLPMPVVGRGGLLAGGYGEESGFRVVVGGQLPSGVAGRAL